MGEVLDFDIKICFNHILSYIMGLKSKLVARDKKKTSRVLKPLITSALLSNTVCAGY